MNKEKTYYIPGAITNEESSIDLLRWEGFHYSNAGKSEKVITKNICRLRIYFLDYMTTKTEKTYSVIIIKVRITTVYTHTFRFLFRTHSKEVAYSERETILKQFSHMKSNRSSGSCYSLSPHTHMHTNPIYNFI